jgi:hypothetical protein
MSAYPADFHNWPEERRNKFFAESARRYRDRQTNGNGAIDAVNDWQHLGALREDASPAAPVASEAPRPLRREPSPGEPFPVDALGDVLGGAARAIIDKMKCPDAIAAGSVLAAASLAIQAHADVVLPATGRARPLSLFVTTVAASGERKSAAH